MTDRNGIITSFAYNLYGNLTSQEDVTGKVTEYACNVLDLLEKVADNGNTVAVYAYYTDGEAADRRDDMVHL